MKRMSIQLVIVLLTGMFMAAPAVAYDHGQADGYAKMSAPVKGAKAGKQLHLMKPDKFVNEVKVGKQFVMVDIRTPGETQFFTGNLRGNLAIPLSRLFEHDQLATLPTDIPIVVLCKSGTRATAAVTALRHIGFTDSYVLKGGFKALVTYLGAPEANKPLGPKTAAR